MYISRVEIDKYNRKKMKSLSHVGAYHSWVEESFPDEVDSGVRSRKLWRIDQLNDKDYLMIVSKDKPDIKALERYGVSGTGSTKLYDSFLENLRMGMKLHFRVVLNPVISKFDHENQKRGRVFPHITEEYQRQFLLDRAEKNGFFLNEEDFQIVNTGAVRMKKRNHTDIHLVQASYEGILKIKDEQQFRETLTEGFGKKKAYGFGLMTVIPLE